MCYWKHGLRRPGPRVLFLGALRRRRQMFRFRVVVGTVLQYNTHERRRRGNNNNNRRFWSAQCTVGRCGTGTLRAVRDGVGCDRRWTGRGVPSADYGDNTRESCWYSVPPPPLSRSSTVVYHHARCVRVVRDPVRRCRIGRRGYGAAAAAAAAVVVVTRVHLLCRHRSRASSLLVIMRRRCSIVVAATTATETAARTTTDSWSIRHRHSPQPLAFSAAKKHISYCDNTIFIARSWSRSHKPARSVCQLVAFAAARTLSAHPARLGSSPLCAGGLHGRCLPRDGQLGLSWLRPCTFYAFRWRRYLWGYPSSNEMSPKRCNSIRPYQCTTRADWLEKRYPKPI